MYWGPKGKQLSRPVGLSLVSINLASSRGSCFNRKSDFQNQSERKEPKIQILYCSPKKRPESDTHGSSLFYVHRRQGTEYVCVSVHTSSQLPK